MLQVTETGIVIDRLDQIHNRLTAAFKTIYGQDIDLQADTPDGQMIGIFSQSLADINEIIAFIVQMLDPYQATGTWLEQRAMYAGLTRRGAEYSYIDNVIVIGARRVDVPAGAVLIDGNRVRWVTMSKVTLDENGSARTQLRSEALGAFDLPANEELRFETVFVGVDKATTTQAAKPGVQEESDAALLLRFMMSHSKNNEDDRAGIQAALLDLSDVKKVLVLENYTGETDNNTSLTPHSVNAIVLGGTDEDIALTLLKKKKGGAAFYGDIEIEYKYRDMVRRVKFDRPQKVGVKVALTFERLQNYTDLAEETIKNNLKAKDFAISEDVYAMKLSCGINNDSNFNLVDIQVNGASKVDIGWREYAVIDEVEITIV